MRKLALLISAFAVACGGGGGGSGGGSALSGTVGGRAFSPVEVRAIAGVTSTSCTVNYGGSAVPLGARAVAVEVTSYANACGDFGSAQCLYHRNGQSVTILIGKVDLTGTVPELTSGDYTIKPNLIDSLEAAGGTLFKLGWATALAPDSNCVGTPIAVTAGTVRLDKVTDPVAGHISLSFAGGDKLEGDFTAPACPGLNPDVCEYANRQAVCTLPAACAP